MEAVQAIMEVAKKNNIRVVPYLAPIRNDIERPFTASDYQRFVADLRAIVEPQGTALLDFAELIPGRYWGQRPPTQLGNAGEVDFLHFQAPGHALLGQKLYDVLRDSGGR
jgi:lysophospholipase L1-like esterase